MRALALIGLILVAACSSLTRYEPRGDGFSSGAVPDSYVVRPGDTLYAIGSRYRLDPRDLARWNDLRDPGRIVVGQRLVLVPPAPAGRAAPAGVPARAGAPAPAGRAAPPGAPSSAGAAPPRPPARATDEAAPAFSWPARGTVVARFGDGRAFATGIGIAGRLGQEVTAAAPGRVIYAGSGGADYGQLVVIEHNDAWLTAYRHNRNLFVTQDESVSRGQKIGEMGIGPDREPRLYFEIRRNGDPLDPETLLPGSD